MICKILCTTLSICVIGIGLYSTVSVGSAALTVALSIIGISGVIAIWIPFEEDNIE